MIHRFAEPSSSIQQRLTANNSPGLCLAWLRESYMRRDRSRVSLERAGVEAFRFFRRLGQV